MANRHRGEISAKLDGRSYTLCLTLGALAELEDAFAAQDLTELTERFAAGRLRADDLVRLIAAGLRGAGFTFTDEEVREMQADGGAVGFARIAADLLSITFSAPEAPA